LNRNVSIYLDAARFTAAFSVLLAHLDEGWAHGLFPFFTHLGLEAVGVFFVLSGFVIAYVTDGRENNAQVYAISRVSRLYSVVIPCLGLTILLDVVGSHFLPHYYQVSWPPISHLPKEFLKVFFSLTFLNSVWRLNIIPGSDAPFWSLSYEAPYYLIFGLFYFLKGKNRWFAGGGACLAFGPHVTALFPLWLLGVWCYRVCKSIEVSRFLARTIFFTSVTLWITSELFRWRYGIGMTTPDRSFKYDWQFYASGIPFAATVVGIWFSSFGKIKFEGFIRWLSGATFTLYLFHYPFARFLNGFIPGGTPLLARWTILLVLTVTAALAFAEITERRKNQWRTATEKISMTISRSFGIAPAGATSLVPKPANQTLGS